MFQCESGVGTDYVNNGKCNVGRSYYVACWKYVRVV